MARIRTIKPSFWEDEKIALLPITCRLFFIGCWTFADDAGVLPSNPVLLKSRIFPYDDISKKEVETWITLLIDQGILLPYEYEGNHLLIIRKWQKHQVVSHPNTAGLLLPPEVLKMALVEAGRVFQKPSMNNSGMIPELIPESSITIPEQSIESSGRDIYIEGKNIGNIYRKRNQNHPVVKEQVELSFPFDSPEFMDVWSKLCEESKWRKKSARALQTSLNQLSKYDERFAILLMESAIANGYQGVVFPNTPVAYEQWKRQNTGLASFDDRCEDVEI